MAEEKRPPFPLDLTEEEFLTIREYIDLVNNTNSSEDHDNQLLLANIVSLLRRIDDKLQVLLDRQVRR